MKESLGATPVKALQGPWIGNAGGLTEIGAHLARDRRDIRCVAAPSGLVGSGTKEKTPGVDAFRAPPTA